MKQLNFFRLLGILLISLWIGSSYGFKSEPENPIKKQSKKESLKKTKRLFQRAYKKYPNIPNGFLEAISFNTTRLKHRIPDLQSHSCTNSPNIYGIMGLTDGNSNILNVIHEISVKTKYTEERIKKNPKTNIFATAKWFNEKFENKEKLTKIIYDYLGFLDQSENSIFLQKDFALQVLKTMQSGIKFNGLVVSEPNYKIHFDTYFTKSFLSKIRSKKIVLTYPKNDESQNNAFNRLTTDYPGATFVSTNCMSSRRGRAITDVVIHDMEGHFTYTVYTLFQNCSRSASAHYCIRSNDGFIVQMVRESQKAWHVGRANSYSIGIEHEGFANDGSWYTEAMYVASANLVKDITNSGYGISPNTCYRGPANTAHQLDPQPTSIKIKGHCHYPLSINSNGHWDPGPYWNWNHYYDLINGVSTGSSDLVIQQMYTVPANPVVGQATTLYVKIKNIGQASANTISFDYRINGSTVSAQTINSISANQIITKQVNYTFSHVGDNNYCVYVGAASNEQNTSNNSYCTVVNAIQNQHSDLVIQQMYTVPATPVVGQATTLYVKIKNIGQASANTISFDYRINGSTISTQTINSISANQIITKQVNYTFSHVGDNNYCVYVGAASNEQNTSNNSYCTVVNAIQNQHSDLVIQQMYTVPANPVVGQATTLYVKIKNIGQASANTISFDYRMNGSTISTQTISSISANQIITKQVNYTFSHVGDNNYCVYVGAASNETNTANNSYCTTISAVAATNSGNNCSGVPAYQSGVVYHAGDRVTNNGMLYEMQGNGVWSNLGACTTSTNTSNTGNSCDGVPAYQSGMVYYAGDRVTNNGMLYEMQANGVWSNLGACDSFKTATIKTEILYPNPVRNTLHVSSLEYYNSDFKITDLFGNVLLNDSFIDGKTDVSNLKEGVYNLMIFGAKRNKIFKLIKK